MTDKKLFIIEGIVRILGRDEQGFRTKRYTHAENLEAAEKNIKIRLAKALRTKPEKVNLVDCSIEEASQNP